MKNLKRKIAILLMLAIALTPYFSLSASANALSEPRSSFVQFESIMLENGDSILYSGPHNRGFLIPRGGRVILNTPFITDQDDESAFFTLIIHKKNSSGNFVPVASKDLFNISANSAESYIEYTNSDGAEYYAFEIINYTLSPILFLPGLLLL